MLGLPGESDEAQIDILLFYQRNDFTLFDCCGQCHGSS